LSPGNLIPYFNLFSFPDLSKLHTEFP